MTVRPTARRRRFGPRRGSVPARAVLALLAAGGVGGCGGIANPYQTTGAPSTPTTGTTTTRADSGDPAAERGGTIPPSAGAAQSRVAIGAASDSPRAALKRYAELYVNWTASDVTTRQRLLASMSLGQARAQALQAAASAGHDKQLLKSRVANTGSVIAISRGEERANGQWVVVTLERTHGQGEYTGLPPTLHVIYAQLTETTSGWVVSEWQPKN